MIEVRGVAKAFGRLEVLNEVDWRVGRGEFWGLIGPNGSGKTTLLNLISGVEQPDSGAIALEGRPLTAYSRKELSRKVAVLQQDGLPSVAFTVREVVEMGRFAHQDWRGREIGGAEAGRRLIDGIMERLDLKELEHRPLGVLSGGSGSG